MALLAKPPNGYGKQPKTTLARPGFSLAKGFRYDDILRVRGIRFAVAACLGSPAC